MKTALNLRTQINTLAGQRKKLVLDARKILDTAEAENRGMKSDEKDGYEKLMSDVDALKERMDAMERAADEEEDGADDEEADDDEVDQAEDRDDDAEQEEEFEEEEDGAKGKDRSGKKFIKVNGRKYQLVSKRSAGTRTKPGGKGPQKRMAWESETEYRTRQRRSTPEYREVFNHYLIDGDKALLSSKAQRAIQADSDIVGGYLVAPQEFVASLIKFVDNKLFIRQESTKYTVKAAQSLGAPSLDVDIADADWTSELDTGNEDTAMAFGKRELTPHPLAKRLKVSNRLLRMGQITSGVSADGSVGGGGPEGLVRDRLGYKFAVAEEKAFMLGNGAQQPLGLFVASSRGIDTSRDVLTGSSTGFTADGLIAAKYNQKVQYWDKLKWIFHRSGLQLIRQLKDANGQYLWVPGGFGGEKDELLDFPVMMSEYAPNTFTTGLYVGLLGDLSFNWIVDSETLQIQRLVELYAAANQTGFIARMELDGMPVLAEAFTRLKTN
jgi:HK97 family phage major capsid protein